jgi:hypothetical protein
MKKALVLAAALALAATPVAAQESASPTAAVQQSAVTSTAPAPSIFVSQDEIRQRVAAAEAEREGAQIGSTSWWYTVLAVALGVLIAMLLLDN